MTHCVLRLSTNPPVLEHVWSCSVLLLRASQVAHETRIYDPCAHPTPRLGSCLVSRFHYLDIMQGLIKYLNTHTRTTKHTPTHMHSVHHPVDPSLLRSYFGPQSFQTDAESMPFVGTGHLGWSVCSKTFDKGTSGGETVQKVFEFISGLVIHTRNTKFIQLGKSGEEH